MGKKQDGKTTCTENKKLAASMTHVQQAVCETTKPCRKHKKQKKSKNRCNENKKDILGEGKKHGSIDKSVASDSALLVNNHFVGIHKNKKRTLDGESVNEVEIINQPTKKPRLGKEDDCDKNLMQEKPIRDMDTELPSSRHKKKNKKRKKTIVEDSELGAVLLKENIVQDNLEAYAEVITLNNTGEKSIKSKKSKTKKKKECSGKKIDQASTYRKESQSACESNQAIADSEDSNTLTKKKKKNKEDDHLSENSVQTEDTPMIVNILEKNKNKKHMHKKTKTDMEEPPVCDTENSQDMSAKKKKRKKCKNIDGYLDGMDVKAWSSEDIDQKKDEKKKHKKSKENEKIGKNRTGVKRSDLDDEVVHLAKKEKTKAKEKKKKKNQRRKLNLTQATLENNCENEIVDDEIMRSATNQNASDLPGGAKQTIKSGQWTTEMFEDKERQNKFLRLLGGFKKTDGKSANSALGLLSGKKDVLFRPAQPEHEASSSGQKALSYQGTCEMNQRLESDYERALAFSVKSQRGIGLGFTPDPAEGKKFHIDINKQASKKFDD